MVLAPLSSSSQKVDPMNRRQFLAGSAAIAGTGLATPRAVGYSAQAPISHSSDIVPTGNSTPLIENGAMFDPTRALAADLGVLLD
jgi:hypothetical protein